jgi:hypothetical protein
VEKLNLPKDGSCKWAGMGDYQLISPNQNVSAIIKYVGEPPHGDSYHSMSVNGNSFPGYIWGCLFAFSSDSRYLVCSWMSKLVERKTVVIDCINQKYFVLPEYIYIFSVQWPKVSGVEGKWKDILYEFTGTETWLSY